MPQYINSHFDLGWGHVAEGQAQVLAGGRFGEEGIANRDQQFGFPGSGALPQRHGREGAGLAR